MNKDDKNHHFVLLIIDVSKHEAKEMDHVKMAGPGFVKLDMHESKRFLPGQFVHSEDGQQFHQYQQNEQPPKTIEQLKKRQHTCMELCHRILIEK
jgi:hypothetical protein